MSDFYHGVKTSQQATAVSTPLTAASGVPFVVGTAPVHMVQGKTNEVVFCKSYADAVSALGYSDDWDKYSLCEVMDVHFKQYGMSPVIFVNVLDASEHKQTVAEEQHTLESGKLKLPLEALQDTVTVKNGDGTVTYTAETDYTLFYSGGYLVFELLEGGAIADAGATLTIGYDAVTPERITKADIIGGFDTSSKKSTGFELIDKVFAKCLLTPDLLLAPGWSHDSEVAAVMAAKAESINGLFEAKALIDADAETVKHYTDVNEWRTKNNITAKEQVVFWPQVALSGKVYHASVHAAALMAQVDTDNGGCPCESPSNKALKIDSTVLADGTEMLLDIAEANHLNSCGIVTALNFIGGFTLWGNYNACYPSNTDVKDYFIPVSRTFSWVASSVVLTHWSKVDRKMNRRLADTIVNEVNIWLNALTSAEKILGGRIEYLEAENSQTDLLAGKVKFHIYLTPPLPAQEIHFVLEYDVSYLTAAMA